MPVRSGFCQGVARDSVLSFGSSVWCGHRPYTEPLDSLGALANGGDAVHLPPMVCGRSATLTGFGTLR